MLHLPTGLFLFFQVFFSLTVAQQQCRLSLNNDFANHPSVPTGVVPFSQNTSASPTSSSQASPAPSRTPFNYGNQTIRGVNLGGWFVLEPWITPSIFENTNDSTIVDEFTLGQKTNFNDTLQILQNHWNTWITEDDFIAIKAAGLNHVRIPLGYWSVPLTSSDTNTSTSVSPYIPGAWPYLLRALNWAAEHDIHVILDLHGAPGSQNGYDNSGQRTSNPQWALNEDNVTRTVDTVAFIGKEIGGMIDILELMNEAAGFLSSTFANVTRQYYSEGYSAVRDVANSSLKIMIGDAFLGVQSWTDFLTAPGAQGVIMDNHQYQIFSDPELARSFQQHLAFTCSVKSTLSSFSSSNIWTIVGEWSNAPTDCAQWLNGRGIGARWDNSITGAPPNGSCTGWTGNYSSFSNDYKTFLRQYWEAQTDVGESIQGWVFWAWKAENADEWSYQRGLEGGWIPQDPTERLFPSPC